MATSNWVLRRAPDFCWVRLPGGYGAEIVTYRWLKPVSFKSLNKQNDGQLRADLLTLRALGYSKFREDAPSDLQKDADYLGTIRSSKRPELRPVLDLQIATDYVEMARLEQEGGNAAMAGRHRQMGGYSSFAGLAGCFK